MVPFTLVDLVKPGMNLINTTTNIIYAAEMRGDKLSFFPVGNPQQSTDADQLATTIRLSDHVEVRAYENFQIIDRGVSDRVLPRPVRVTLAEFTGTYRHHLEFEQAVRMVRSTPILPSLAVPTPFGLMPLTTLSLEETLRSRLFILPEKVTDEAPEILTYRLVVSCPENDRATWVTNARLRAYMLYILTVLTSVATTSVSANYHANFGFDVDRLIPSV